MTSSTNFSGSTSTGTGINPYGEELDIFAPGVNVSVAEHNTSGNIRLSGTSCSGGNCCRCGGPAVEKNSLGSEIRRC